MTIELSSIRVDKPYNHCSISFISINTFIYERFYLIGYFKC